MDVFFDLEQNMKNKKDSYMGDVGFPGKMDDIPELMETV
jgi:hypothetical protein